MDKQKNNLKHNKRNLSKTKLGKTWKRFTYFLNEDDSFWSLLANIAIAFILIKFIVYPGLGLVLGTNYPIVAVVSGSMEHQGSFDDWWDSPAIYDSKKTTQSMFYQQYNITKEKFQGFSFDDGFNTGDIMVLTGKKTEDIEIGDVIVFTSKRPEPVIHRVIERKKKNDTLYFRTKGDHNPTTYFFEKDITEENIIGVARFRIPWLGWIKIIFVKAILCVFNLNQCFAF